MRDFSQVAPRRAIGLTLAAVNIRKFALRAARLSDLAELGSLTPAAATFLEAAVRATLQHADRDEIYAVGDCARFLPAPLPRIGVHGVRQGPVLHRSLLARVRGEPLPVYEPQRRTLSILDLGDGIGLAVRGRWWWYGAGPLRLKRYIDRRWLKAYQAGRSSTWREWRSR